MFDLSSDPRRIRIRYPGSWSSDPDPHQNEADPEHLWSRCWTWNVLLNLALTGKREKINQYFSTKLLKLFLSCPICKRYLSTPFRYVFGLFKLKILFSKQHFFFFYFFHPKCSFFVLEEEKNWQNLKKTVHTNSIPYSIEH